MNNIVTTIHQITMASFGFLLAATVYGGPLGFAPAWAALIGEINDGGVKVPGLIMRIFKRAGANWRAALPGGLAICLISAIILYSLPLAPNTNTTILAILLIWSVLFAIHVAHMVANDLADKVLTKQSFVLCFLGSWLYFLVLVLLIISILLGFTVFFPLVVVFAPWLVAKTQTSLSTSVLRATALLFPAEV